MIQIKFTGKVKTSGLFDASSPLSEISNVFPIEKVRLIYNGIILNKHLSFSFYGMQDDSVIHVINDCPISHAEIRRMQKEEEAKQIHDLHIYFLQKKLNYEQPYSFNSKRSEIARLKDLSFSKHEITTRRYKRIARFFVKRNHDDNNCDSPLETIIPDKSDAPSTEILPFQYFE